MSRLPPVRPLFLVPEAPGMSLSFPRFSGMMSFPWFPRRSGNEGSVLFQWLNSQISFPGMIVPGNE
jgi:hypothetical protein